MSSSFFRGKLSDIIQNIFYYTVFTLNIVEPSIVWTPMAHILWLIRTCFLSPYRILPTTQGKQTFRGNFLIYHEIICCVFWVHSTYDYCVENLKHFPKLLLFASWPGTINNPQWLKLSYLKQISMVLKMFAPLKFDCIYTVRYIQTP